jgi:3',5'-cyclic AMP phosphodiesterase CpdA
MTPKFWLISVCLCQLALSCKKDVTDALPPANGELKMAIVSDIHYMHPSLLVNNGAAGTPFQNYLDQDPKLVQYSDPIWRQVMGELQTEKPDILLVPGDITKDGEKIGHQAMATFFAQLESNGTRVYVMPGNHDINNAKAKIYDGNTESSAEQTSKTDFPTIYANFGYSEAIARDPNSLSYVAQLQPGLRLLSIDASRYDDFTNGDIAEGRIKPQTLTWVLAQIAAAKQQNIEVYGMMHHNLIEHYAGQSRLDSGYVVNDWESITPQLMEAGLKIIFTGHYHANDISSYTHNGKVITDIQTGSLVTAPSPYRIVTLKDKQLVVKSKVVSSIAANLPGSVTFPNYANLFLSQHLDGYFNYYLANKLGAPANLAAFASPLFRNGIMAHFAGDENMSSDELAKINNLRTMSPLLADIVTILWTDTGIKDNTVTIDY